MPQLHRYIPEGAEEIRRDGGAVYTYTLNGRICALAYRGRQARPEWAHGFRDTEQRDRKVAEFFASVEHAAAEKARMRAERAAFQHDLQAGDVIVNSWGYDQTNIDFYEVVRVQGKRVVIRPIAARSEAGSGYPHGMADRCLPCLGEFTGPEMLKTPRGFRYHTEGEWRTAVPFPYGSGQKWDGKPEYRSWYA